MKISRPVPVLAATLAVLGAALGSATVASATSDSTPPTSSSPAAPRPSGSLPAGSDQACDTAKRAIESAVPAYEAVKTVNDGTDLATARTKVLDLLAALKQVSLTTSEALKTSTQGGAADLVAQATELLAKSPALTQALDEAATKAQAASSMTELGAALQNPVFTESDNLNIFTPKFAALRLNFSTSAACATMLETFGATKLKTSCSEAVQDVKSLKGVLTELAKLNSQSSLQELQPLFVRALEADSSIESNRREAVEVIGARAELQGMKAPLTEEAADFLAKSVAFKAAIDDGLARVKSATDAAAVLAVDRDGKVAETGKPLVFGGGRFANLASALSETPECKAMVEATTSA